MLVYKIPCRTIGNHGGPCKAWRTMKVYDWLCRSMECDAELSRPKKVYGVQCRDMKTYGSLWRFM